MVRDIALIPSEANKAFAAIQGLLAESLVAVYLHGSAVAGGLRPYSDVDLLVVIDKPMVYGVRERLTAELLNISGLYPHDPCGRHPLEVMVFLRSDLSTSVYPARSEFVYGEWLRHEIGKGKIPEPCFDPELTLLLAQARQEAKPLVGPDAFDVLPAIPWSDIRRAIADGLPALIDTLQSDPRNVLLTLARMWRTLTTGEFVSKDVAAEWAAARLSAEQAAVLSDARKAYLGIRDDKWDDRNDEIRRTARALHDTVALLITIS